MSLPTWEECRDKNDNDPLSMNPLEIFIFEWCPDVRYKDLFRQQLSDAIQYVIDFNDEK